MANIVKRISTLESFQNVIKEYTQTDYLDGDLYVHPDGDKYIIINRIELRKGKETIIWTLHEINPHTSSNHGFKVISIGGQTKYWHRVIAETFIPNPFDYKRVIHKDGNRMNNSVSNLEWR